MKIDKKKSGFHGQWNYSCKKLVIWLPIWKDKMATVIYRLD